jgi:hypothetical protein
MQVLVNVDIVTLRQFEVRISPTPVHPFFRTALSKSLLECMAKN